MASKKLLLLKEFNRKKWNSVSDCKKRYTNKWGLNNWFIWTEKKIILLVDSCQPLWQIKGG